MSVKYIDGFKTIKSARYATCSIDDLYLDEDNPRFAAAAFFTGMDKSQSSIIQYLAEYGDILKLAEKINEYSGLFNEFTISGYINEHGQLVVLEGNRRIAACKILLNPDILSVAFRNNTAVVSPSKETIENIKEVNLVIYGKSIDAQQYIASKHTLADVREWSPIEKTNYYYTQFKNGSTVSDISKSVMGAKPSDIKKKISQYLMYESIFSITRKKHINLRTESTHLLPLVEQFIWAIKDGGKYGLNLILDEDTLQYQTLPSKKDLYNEILLLIGEAFFVRPEAKKEDLKLRSSSSQFRISTNEVKPSRKVINLIDEDVRIPGLKQKINFFNNIIDEPTISFSEPPFSSDEDPRPKNDQNADIDNDTNRADGNGKGSDERHPNPSLKRSFFKELDYSNLNVDEKDNHALIVVCEEMVKISTKTYYGTPAYEAFPISATFLLRSLLEQTLIRHFINIDKRDFTLNQKGRTVELEKLILALQKQAKNDNYECYFYNDKKLANSFKDCLTGLATKHQMDIVVHRPHDFIADKYSLNSLAHQGLFNMIQSFIGYFH